MLLGAGAGCSDGPEVASVEDTVTLDGQPLEGALLIFTPKEGGRQSGGQTGSEGYYELTFSRDQDGALPGTHTIMISTIQEGDPDQGIPTAPEKLPAKYNTQTELSQQVESGENVIDFSLDSQRKIVPPTLNQ